MASSPTVVERRWVRAGGLALAALAVVYVVPLDAVVRDWLYTIVTVPLIAGSAVLALQRAQRDPRERLAWTLIGFAGVAWAIGEAGWAWVSLVQGQELPFPHWTDVFYLLNTPLMVAGILAFAWRPGTRHAAVQALDALLVAGGLFLAAWLFFVRGIVSQETPGDLGLAVTLAYPVGDIAILAAAILALARLTPERRRLAWPLLAGVACMVVADSGYSLVVVTTGSYDATWFDLGWGLAAFGIGWAALRDGDPAAVRLGAASRLEEFASTLALLPAIVAVSVEIVRHGSLDRVTAVAGLLTAVVLLARQAVFLNAHVRISRDLDAANRLAGLGAWSTDRSGRVRLDDGAVRLTGLAPDDPINLAYFLDRLAGAQGVQLLHDAEALAPLASLERTVRLGGADGDRYLQVHVQRLRDRNLRGTILDVTSQVRLEQERQRGQAQAVEAIRLAELARAKTKFINTAAHELSTPLTPILLSLANLKRNNPGAPLGILERNVDRLARLLHDVLEGARLQADHLRLDRHPMDLALLARDCVEEHQPLAQAASVTLQVDASDTLPVDADAARLHEVLMNLLSNALKFTPAGGRVVVRAREVGSVAQVEVTDTGRGLLPTDLAMLFQPFTQVGEPSPGSGTGLGLYISRGIVEQHGGHIEAASPGAGRGATFRFQIPLAKELLAELPPAPVH